MKGRKTNNFTPQGSFMRLERKDFNLNKINQKGTKEVKRSKTDMALKDMVFKLHVVA